MSAEPMPEDGPFLSPHEAELRAVLGFYATQAGLPPEVEKVYLQGALEKTADEPERRLSVIKGLTKRLKDMGVALPEEILLSDPVQESIPKPKAVRTSRAPKTTTARTSSKITRTSQLTEEELLADSPESPKLEYLEVGAEPDAESQLAAPEEIDWSLDKQAPNTDLVKVYLLEIGKVPLLKAEEEVQLAKEIEAGVLAQEKLTLLNAHQISANDLPNNATIEELTKLVKLGEQAKQHMINANLRLVVNYAKGHSGKGISLLDLIQEGNLGLIRAVQKFDYTKGWKFSTYATWWIRQSIGRAFADQGRLIRLPVHAHEQFQKMEKESREFEEEHGRRPTTQELAELVGLPLKKVQDIREGGRQPVSLNMPIGEGGHGRGETPSEFADILPDKAVHSFEDQIVYAELSRKIQIAFEVADLSAQEQHVLRLRLGFEGETPTLEEVGIKYGVTRERARQIFVKGIGKLKQNLNNPAVAELLDYLR